MSDNKVGSQTCVIQSSLYIPPYDCGPGAVCSCNSFDVNGDCNADAVFTCACDKDSGFYGTNTTLDYKHYSKKSDDTTGGGGENLPSCDTVPPACQDGAATRSASFGTLFGMSLANMFGLGGIISDSGGGRTALDDVRDQISSINEKTQDFNQDMQLQFDTDVIKLESQLFGNINAVWTEMRAMDAYTSEKLTEKIDSNGVYIASSFVIILIILLWIIFFEPSGSIMQSKK